MRRLAIGVLSAILLSGTQSTVASATQTDRFEGANRYGTSVSVSESAWTSSNTDVIYLARGDVLADALSAGTLRGGPILLTRTGTLPPEVDAEISRLGNKPIVVLGGPTAVSDTVARLAARGNRYERLSGRNREATSAAISEYAFPTSNTVYVTESRGTDGQGSPDAVAGGALTDGPILLVNGKVGPTQEVQDEIERLGATKVVQLGGNPLRTPITSSVSGDDRYETATRIASRASGNPSTVYIARGDVFADAVSAGSLTDGPVVLTRTSTLPPVTCQWLTANQPSRIVAVGSSNAVSATVLSKAKRCAEDTPATALEVQAATKLTRDFTETSESAALRKLNGLTVAPAGSMTGYSRDNFPHWLDASAWGWPVAPDNSCDVRNAALYRDGHNVTISASCVVQSGRWLDPYTATWYNNKSDIDIDHLIPLAEAWRSGAKTWGDTQRRTFANDRLVVVAVDDGANQSKGDKTPADWKPSNEAAWCLYGQRYTSVKVKYSLTITSGEKSALKSMIGTCE